MLTFAKIFGKLPDHNHLYLKQEVNGYKIFNHNKTIEIYHALAKTATTRAKYRIRNVSDAIALGSIIQGQSISEYRMLGAKDEEIGKVRIGDKEIELIIGDQNFTSLDIGRAKRFDFVDKNKKYVLSIDKKILSVKDEYHILFIDEFTSLIAVMLAIIIDDYFHSGTT